MLRIEVTHTFDVSVAEAFAYITDMKNWPEYWPGFIRIDNPAAAGWSNPGDRATVVIKLLNRERALNMELEAFQKDASVTYVSRQRGLPDVRHERHFEAARNGCVYRLIVEYEPRTGFAGLFDRTVVRRSVEQAMRRTMQNLDRLFARCRLLAERWRGAAPRLLFRTCDTLSYEAMFVDVCRCKSAAVLCQNCVTYPPDTPGQHRHLRGHAEADRCCGKSLIGSALVRFGVRQHARAESISKRAPIDRSASLRFRINSLRAV